MSNTESIRKRAAAWCAADDPKLTCGTGPLARYVYMLRLLAQLLPGPVAQVGEPKPARPTAPVHDSIGYAEKR